MSCRGLRKSPFQLKNFTMNSGSLDAHLNDEDRARLAAFESSNESNFVRCGELLGLDKGSDWRYLNLSGSDFSDCDLRGFDFTGADLRGCTGINVIIDHTTVFEGADVDGSVFSLAVATAKILSEFPELGREYQKIKRAYWTDQHNWVADCLTQQVKNPEARQALALALYFETADPVVRKTIIQYLVFKATNLEGRIGFLARLASDRDTDIGLLLSSISMLSTLYRGSEPVLLLLLSIAEDRQNQDITRTTALTGCLSHRFIGRHLSRAKAIIDDIGDGYHENLYVRAVAGLVGVEHTLAVTGGRPLGGVSLSRPIEISDVFSIVNSLWQLRNSAESDRPPGLDDLVAGGYVSLALNVMNLQHSLQAHGLPLLLRYDPATVQARAAQRPNADVVLPIGMYEFWTQTTKTPSIAI